jgi:hypothetical protein
MARFAPDHEISAFNGGTNRRDAPVGLASNDLIASENIVPIAGGSIEGRGGQSELFGTAIDSNAIRSLHRLYLQNGTRKTIATSGTKVWTVTGAGQLEIDSGYTSGKKFSMLTWSAKDKAYWINGVEPLKSYDGTTVATVAGTPPIGSMVELHDNRLWVLQGNLVRFSDLNLDNSWPGANALNISDNAGGTGQFIKSFGRGLLIIGKDTGLYRFEGSPLLGGSLTRFSDVKCIAPWSAAVTPFGVPFVSDDGVWATDGFAVNRISGKLDPVFSGLFRTAVGGYYPLKRQYLLAFSTTGAANDQFWTATYLETPQGPTVSWNPYTGFNAEAFSAWGGSGDNGEIYYGLSNTGKIRRMAFGQQDVGIDYRASFQTRWDSFGSLTRAKQVRWLFPVMESTNPVNYQIGYTFGQAQTAGGLEQRFQGGIEWGPGSVVFGPGTVTWLAGGAIQNEVTSVLNFDSGRFASFYFENTGDGPNFKFFNLGVQLKVKDAHNRQIFSIAS